MASVLKPFLKTASIHNTFQCFNWDRSVPEHTCMCKTENWRIDCPTRLPVRLEQHSRTHNVLTAACLSPPRARYLHQFWWPQDDCAHRRPHASSPNLPRYRRGAANLSNGREKKAPQMTIKPGQYFMKMKCSGTVYSGRGSGREEGGPEPPNEWMQSSHHVEFFFIQTRFTRGGHRRLGLPGATSQGRSKQEVIGFSKCQHFTKMSFFLVFTFQNVLTFWGFCFPKMSRLSCPIF